MRFVVAGGSPARARALSARSVLFLSVCVLVGAGCKSEPATVTVERLALPEATQVLPDGYTMPHSVLERPDGRVLVSDRRHRELWLTDFGTGARTTFGTSGDGPGEYRRVQEVLPLAGDSVGVVAFGAPYLISVLSPEGRPARTARLGDEYGRGGAGESLSQMPIMTRADSAGRLYGVPTLGRSPAGKAAGEPELAVVRLASPGSAPDTVCWLPRGEMAEPENDSTNRLRWTLGRGFFAARNDWAVLPDGTVVLINAATYELAFCRGARTVRTVQVPAPRRIAVKASAYHAHLDSTEAFARQSMLSAAALIAAGKGGAAAVPPSLQFERPEPPEFFSPVLVDAVRRTRASAYRLWIPVSGPDSPMREYWDVIDTLGVRHARYVLPIGTELRAVSPKFVYTIRKDDDDLYWVERRANPVP
jgi:hypothetical protein